MRDRETPWVRSNSAAFLLLTCFFALRTSGVPFFALRFADLFYRATLRFARISTPSREKRACRGPRAFGREDFDFLSAVTARPRFLRRSSGQAALTLVSVVGQFGFDGAALLGTQAQGPSVLLAS